MPVRILPTHVVNKIAAGEVIERPASIAKELVENALDADAARIEIAVEDGGRRLISVTDDGCGMDADDLALAFRPHATSKIASDEDLDDIATMGFRGEALASIASVSHASIRSRPRGQESGHEVAAAGEEIGEVRPCAAPPGTAVTVRDLFFNTPARRKFMRTASTEFGHISEQLARLALPHPKVAFRLTHNGRESQNLPAVNSTTERAADLFGRDLADTLLPVRPRGGEVGIAGLIAPPAGARASGKWQYFFLNGRYIRDRLLAHALREAYRGLIEPQRWPVAFLFVEIPPGEVDVNVHPTKIEVRFRNGNLVHGELLAALRETLNRSNLAVPVDPGTAPAEPPPEPEAPAGDEAGDARRSSLRQALADFFRSAPPQQPSFRFPEGHRAAPTGARPAPPLPRPAAGTPSFGRAGESSPKPLAEPEAGGQPVAAPTDVLQIHNAYIVSPSEDGLRIIDQHALHERLLYNDFKRRLAEGRLTAQRMLLPQTLNASPAELAALDDHAGLLGRLGIEVAPFGPGTAAVQQFPSLLAERGVEPGAFVREILDRLADEEATSAEELLEDMLSMMACKAAVKAGDPLTDDEMRALLDRREEAEKSSACPHGRPTTLELTLKDLEKQFRRT